MFVLDQKMMDAADAFEEIFQQWGPTWFVDEAIQQSNGLYDNDGYYKLAKVVASEQKAKLKWKISRGKEIGMVLGHGVGKKHLILPRGNYLCKMAEKIGEFNSTACKAININLEKGVFTEDEAERREGEENG